MLYLEMIMQFQPILHIIIRINAKELQAMDNNEVVVTEEVAAVVENSTGIEIEPLFEEQVDFDTFSKSDFRVVKVKNCEAVPKSKKNVTWSAIQIPLHIVYMDFFH